VTDCSGWGAGATLFRLASSDLNGSIDPSEEHEYGETPWSSGFVLSDVYAHVRTTPASPASGPATKASAPAAKVSAPAAKASAPAAKASAPTAKAGPPIVPVTAGKATPVAVTVTPPAETAPPQHAEEGQRATAPDPGR